MGDCTYCGKRRINFNQDEDYTMRIENNDRGDYVIVTGELMIDSIPISFCPFCGRDLHKEGGPMTTHRLKVFVKYADAIMNGTKTFEIRKNDRGYEVGDKIVFDVVTNEATPSGRRQGIRSTGRPTESTTSSTTSRASPKSTSRWPFLRWTNE